MMSGMNRRKFLRGALGVSGAMCLSGLAGTLGASEASQRRPNILMILGDDATYNDLPLYGGRNVKTPRIDRLASEGKLFTHAYASMAMCQPCRTELYTGLYPMRTGTCWNHSATKAGTESICHALRPLGYRVGITGKTHVVPRSCFPFDAVAGFEDNCVAPTADINCEGIARYMKQDPSQPFCLVVGLVVPHVVWTVGDPSHFDPKTLTLPPNLADTPQTRRDYAKYLAEIEVLDQQVGAVLDTLEASGQADNTLVIFSSEQGAQFPGCKWTNYDTGVRTGFVARWPGRIKAGSRTDAIIQYADVLPTLIEAAGGRVKAARYDGASFLEALTGDKPTRRQYAYAMHNNLPEGPAYPIRSVRDKQYRYIRNLSPDSLHVQRYIMGKPEHNPYWNTWMWAAADNPKTERLVSRYLNRPAEELYDSEQDPYELNNLADNPRFADVKARLSKELDRWMTEQGDPGAALDTMEMLNASRRAAKR